MYLLQIGRNKSLACAELESKYGNTTELTTDIVLCDQPDVDINSLGSVIKTGKVIEAITADKNIATSITDAIVYHCQQDGLTSIDFGMSLYTQHSHVDIKKYNKILIEIKKGLKKSGVKSRFVTAKTAQLSAPQVIHNKLTTKGVEFMVVYSKDKIYIAKTQAVQDISSYSFRDYSRPCRDTYVGMLPPKLAQILINLSSPQNNTTIYDPFCGSGVVVQEALLFGYNAKGSDISSKMVACSTKNLAWLQQKYSIINTYSIALQDALKLPAIELDDYCIVTEGYLGKPMHAQSTYADIAHVQREVSELYVEFLTVISRQEKKPKSIAITLPFWKTKNKIFTLNILDELQKLGYTIKQFESVDGQKLYYIREGQVVGRQVIVLNLN